MGGKRSTALKEVFFNLALWEGLGALPRVQTVQNRSAWSHRDDVLWKDGVRGHSEAKGKEEHPCPLTFHLSLVLSLPKAV